MRRENLRVNFYTCHLVLCFLQLQLKELITKDEFKFTCAIVVLDFLIRHGEITPDNGENFFVAKL